MFIFRLLNIMVDQKISYNDKAAHVSQKIVLYLKGVIVNTENYNQRSRSLHLKDKQHKQFSTPHKEKPTRKRREKRKQGARLVEALKSHKTQIQNFISRKLQSP